MIHSSRTYTAVPPGETILEQLEYYNISRTQFAQRMELSGEDAERLLGGEIVLSPEIAARLEQVLGPSARFWTNLESLYRENRKKVRAENKKEAMKRRSQSKRRRIKCGR